MTRRLASSFTLAADQRPEDVPGVMLALPTYRFWGTRKPPKAAVFQMLAAPRLGTDGADGADNPTSVTIRVYGPIDSWGGFWGVSSKEVAEALDSLPESVTSIQLRINSPGGEVFEAMTILNMLRAHPASTQAVVDGVAASAASFLAAGCDETVMSPGTQLMIHDARTFAYGPPKVMRKVADILDSLSSSAADLYAEAAGGTGDTWRALMVEETWYSAAEAVTAGLADRVGVVPDEAFAITAGDDEDEDEDEGEGDEGDDTPDETPENRFDFTVFAYAGRQNAPAPPGLSTSEGALVDFTDEQAATMRQQLGLPDDADQDTIVAAMAEALNERADTPDTPTPPAAPSLPDGVVAVDATVLEDLRAGAEAGRAAHTRQAQEDRDRAIASAVSSGRIPPARRAHWSALWDKDPEGTATTLAKLEPGLIPISEIGTGADDADSESGEAVSADERARRASFAAQMGIPEEELV